MVREGAGGERWPVVRSRLLLVVTHMLDSYTATNSGVTCKPVRQLDRECPGPSSGRSSRAPGGGGPPLRGLAGSGPAQGLQCRASSLVSVEGVSHVWFIGVQPPLSFGSASPLFSVFPFSLLPSLSFFSYDPVQRPAVHQPLAAAMGLSPTRSAAGLRSAHRSPPPGLSFQPGPRGLHLLSQQSLLAGVLGRPACRVRAPAGCRDGAPRYCPGPPPPDHARRAGRASRLNRTVGPEPAPSAHHESPRQA